MNEIPVYEAGFRDLIVGDVQTVLLDRSEKVEVPSPRDDYKVGDCKTLSCSCCKIKFTNASEQREHYKLDWHRYNLKRNLSGKDVISEDEFNSKYDDVSSISGSDTDSEKEDGIEEMVRAQGKLFLKSGPGKVFSVYRCLLAEKKAEIDQNAIARQLERVHSGNKWTVFMLGGGHFAGAVFDRDVPILHKTFHCYTVRAGQGGSQSARDNKSATSNPRSAGASLRRYNEQAFGQHITDIVTRWSEDIAASSLVFCRAPGPYNKSILFGGKTPLLSKGDGRLRYIPFSTRRATFAEVKRVHAQLATVSVYDSVETVLNKYTESKRNKVRNTSINRAKSREPLERPLPDSFIESEEESPAERPVECSVHELEINFKDSLQPFEDTERRKHPPKKKRKNAKSKNQRRLELEKARKEELVNVIKSGDLSKLQNVFKTYDDEEISGGINEVLDDDGNSLLHLAAFFGKEEMVQFLLDNEADVCAKNKKQQTAYTCNKSAEIRDVFKTYASSNPDKHNYNKAQIPVASLSPEELENIVEKKKQQKKAKRDKEREKRKIKESEQKEQCEKNRFASLSDREKRALAAERRILSQSGSVIARCFLCGQDISGRVPFEYLGNRFCTIECLKAHRIKNHGFVS